MLRNKNLVAKISVDTAENEPFKVCREIGNLEGRKSSSNSKYPEFEMRAQATLKRTPVKTALGIILINPWQRTVSMTAKTPTRIPARRRDAPSFRISTDRMVACAQTE